MGQHRETIRRLVAEGDGDPERIMPLVVAWIEREAPGKAEFAFSVMEEFGCPVPPSLVKAILDAGTVAGGDPARAHAILHEALDERENPKASDAVWDAVHDTLLEALTKVLEEEIQRHDSQ